MTNNKKPKRIIIHNFVNPKDAIILTKFFDKNKNLCGDERVFHKDKTIHFENIKNNKIKNLLNYYALKNEIFIDHCFAVRTKEWQKPRLCCWSKGQYMDLHVDKQPKQNDTMDYSSLIYLNDKYTGGELVFKNEDGVEEVFKMKALSNMIFESDKRNKHGVKKILNGKRYTVPSWYIKKYDK